jgi:hypothetical protein
MVNQMKEAIERNDHEKDRRERYPPAPFPFSLSCLIRRCLSFFINNIIFIHRRPLFSIVAGHLLFFLFIKKLKTLRLSPSSTIRGLSRLEFIPVDFIYHKIQMAVGVCF